MPSHLVHLAAQIGASGNTGLRRVARDKATGRLWSMYRRQAGGIFHQWVAYSDDLGVNWTEEQASSGTATATDDGSIAVDSVGDVHIAFNATGYGAFPGQYQVIYRKRQAGVWQAEELVTDVNNCAAIQPCIALDASDDIYILWCSAGWGVNVLFQKPMLRKKQAGVWQAREIVQDPNQNQQSTSIAIDSGGNVHCTWAGAVPNAQINVKYRRRTAAGAWDALEEVTTSAQIQRFCSVSLDPSDNPSVIWVGRPTPLGANPMQYQVNYKKKSGGAWGGWELVTDKAEQQGAGSICCDSDGVEHVCWAGLGWPTHPAINNIQHRARTAGAWGSITAITDAAISQTSPCQFWAKFPTGGIPKSGFGFLYANGTDVYYYDSADLLWGMPVGGDHRYHYSKKLLMV